MPEKETAVSRLRRGENASRASAAKPTLLILVYNPTNFFSRKLRVSHVESCRVSIKSPSEIADKREGTTESQTGCV